ncbi:hypothetical protein [Sulfitobacter donghicola]|uniref:Sodium:proton antiporter n=1 Tax=Sulfitobacter donghicola DSW-25 = KCTC 12864 = JCM 14565 TaxID=1300350 RepID=A0A073IH50_9RHOB|nr:hypothetical protein [Sulfitobacter donghicola]KEJ88885.1 hypothetical protein DSW25_13970 [Sulfitobacter donghicola DSW-25 = KCTC 12864 = JCM 14565]KIN68539.1 hypothetical protein Z948_2270 [Sulfitobacter donghicola DSW-25 = KCTC 12864 = JCM 14565]
MIVLAVLYIILGFGALTALAAMILRIGTLLGQCPESSAAIRAAAVTIATGFAAIGAGGVILIGAVLPLLNDAPMVGFLAALGFAALCLGLGFTQAVGTLRAVMQDYQRKDPVAEPA